MVTETSSRTVASTTGGQSLLLPASPDLRESRRHQKSMSNLRIPPLRGTTPTTKTLSLTRHLLQRAESDQQTPPGPALGLTQEALQILIATTVLAVLQDPNPQVSATQQGATSTPGSGPSFVPPVTAQQGTDLWTEANAQSSQANAPLPAAKETETLQLQAKELNRKTELMMSKAKEKDPLIFELDAGITAEDTECELHWVAKILKKYDKRTGRLLRLPFIQKVLKQPFFTTDLISKPVKECENTIDAVSPAEEEKKQKKEEKQKQWQEEKGYSGTQLRLKCPCKKSGAEALLMATTLCLLSTCRTLISYGQYNSTLPYLFSDN